MGIVRRNSAWILTTAACWVAVGVFYFHLESLCRENPGCSESSYYRSHFRGFSFWST